MARVKSVAYHGATRRFPMERRPLGHRKIRTRRSSSLHAAVAAREEGFGCCDQCGANNAFGCITPITGLVQAKSQSEREQNVSENIAEHIEAAAPLRFKIFGARDLTVAAIENTENLEQCRPGDETKVIAAQQQSAPGDRQREYRQCPCAGGEVRLQQHTADRARDGPVQIFRDESILWLAAAPEEPSLGSRNFLRRSTATPTIHCRLFCTAASKGKCASQFFPSVPGSS